MRSQGWVTGINLADDVTRTVLHAGPVNKFSISYQRTPLISTMQAAQQELEVVGSRYQMAGAGRMTKTGDAPPGIMPGSLPAALVAALPGELPNRVEVWVLDPTADRSFPVTYEFTTHATVKVPMARPGTTCEQERTVMTPVEMLVGTVSTGVRRDPIKISVVAPHFAMSDDTKCVQLPQR